MEDALKNALTSIAEFVPKLVAFLLILLIGLFVARLIAKAIGKVLEKVGFNRAVERAGAKKALEKSTFEASDIVGKLVYYSLALFVLQLAFGVFGPNPISALITAVIAFLPKVIVAVIIIVVVAAAIAAAVKTLIQGTLGGLSYGKALANIAAIFILGLGVIAALNQVEVATTVTTPVLIAVLATVAGVIIVGAGGGLVKPMQTRWETYLSTAEAEAPKLRQQADNAANVKERPSQGAETAKAGHDTTDSSRQAPGASAAPYNQSDTTRF